MANLNFAELALQLNRNRSLQIGQQKQLLEYACAKRRECIELTAENDCLRPAVEALKMRCEEREAVTA